MNLHTDLWGWFELTVLSSSDIFKAPERKSDAESDDRSVTEISEVFCDPAMAREAKKGEARVAEQAKQAELFGEAPNDMSCT